MTFLDEVADAKNEILERMGDEQDNYVLLISPAVMKELILEYGGRPPHTESKGRKVGLIHGFWTYVSPDVERYALIPVDEAPDAQA